MKQKIVARVKLNPDNLANDAIVIVRKTIFREDGMVDKKYGLSKEGDWIEVSEGEMHPEECYLPVAVHLVKKE